MEEKADFNWVKKKVLGKLPDNETKQIWLKICENLDSEEETSAIKFLESSFKNQETKIKKSLDLMQKSFSSNQ